jgi:hypothetical protein
VHPTLRKWSDGAPTVDVDAATAGAALLALARISQFKIEMFAWRNSRPPATVVMRNGSLLKGRYNARPLAAGDVIRLVPMM